MTTEAPELPEFVLDHLGQEVRVGDTIAYGVMSGYSATLSVSEVLGFQWTSSEWNPALKIKVQGTDGSAGRKKNPGLIEARFKRFVFLKPGYLSRPCQVGDLSSRRLLPCEFTEGGGQRCERLDPHEDDDHRWSDHTIRHERAGNGWACSMFTESRSV